MEEENNISNLLKQANEEIAALKQREEQLSAEAEDNSNVLTHLTE